MTGVTSDRLMSRQSGHASAIAMAALTMLVTLCAALIGLQLQEYRVAVFWPAAGVITGLVLATRRGPQRVAALGGALGALLLGNLLQQRGLAASAVFMTGNIGEALLIAAVLGANARPLRLESLPRIGAFLAATAVVVALVGLLTAAGLTVVGTAGGDYWRVWQLWFTSHSVGIVSVAPAIVAVRHAWDERHDQAFLQPSDWLRLVVFAALVYIAVGEIPNHNEEALIAVLAAVYAMLLWISATSGPMWSALALLALSASVAWHTGHGDGLFHQSERSAQMFLAVAALWTLTLGVLLEQERRSRRAAGESAALMREALFAGRAFAFEWNPATNMVVRSDERGVLGPVRIESATSFFERVHADDRERFLATLERLDPAANSYETTYRYHHPDGRIIWLEERASARFDDGGRLLRLRGLTADVSERKAAEEALRDADRMKDRFIATLSHELRNPLAPIRTAVAVLRKQTVDDSRAQWCHQVIERQAAHMAHLLDELLDVSRVSLGKFKLASEEVELAEVLRRAGETVAPQYDAGGYTLALEVPPQPIRLRADPVRLTQALSNLLSNAAKYADPGSTTRVKAALVDGGRHVRIAVQDDGVGIDPAQLDRVFEMFWQIDSSLDRAQGGLGIGLWLVRQIVTLHGGSIEACSAGVGKGSEFVLTLPMVPAREEGRQVTASRGVR